MRRDGSLLHLLTLSDVLCCFQCIEFQLQLDSLTSDPWCRHESQEIQFRIEGQIKFPLGVRACFRCALSKRKASVNSHLPPLKHCSRQRLGCLRPCVAPKSIPAVVKLTCFEDRFFGIPLHLCLESSPLFQNFASNHISERYTRKLVFSSWISSRKQEPFSGV